MAIKIEMLRVFHAVVDNGSLGAAAEALGRTPSAVSMMLKQFEDHVGAPLFEAARKSRLTPLGTLVAAEAARELAHFDRTVAAIEGLSQAERGLVRIAATPSLAQTLLPPVLRAFLADRPGVAVDLRDMATPDVHAALQDERADIGLASAGPVRGLDGRKLMSDPFGVVCRNDHPLARDWARLTWADLRDVPFILNGLCDQIGDEGFAPLLAASRLTVPNTTSLLAMVNAGVGITLLPRLAVLPGYTDLTFLKLTDTSARRDIWLLSQPEDQLTPAARSMRDAVMAAATQFNISE
jgi:DNA-binding transcriptional LysR family regulator